MPPDGAVGAEAVCGPVAGVQTYAHSVWYQTPYELRQLAAVHYIPLEWMQGFMSDEARALDRMQMELVRVASAVNECFY